MKEKIGKDGLTKSQRYYFRHLEERKASGAAYRAKNLERIRARDRAIKANEKLAMTPEELRAAQEKRAAYDREYRKKNKEKRKALADAWRQTKAAKSLYRKHYDRRKVREGIPDRAPANPMTAEELKEYRRQYWEKNKKVLTEKNREWRIRNLDRQIKKGREYYRNNKQKYFDNNNRRTRARKAVDIEFKILSALRGRISHFLRGTSRSLRTRELIGCSLEKLRAHLEKQFTDGMTWENYGRKGWHIDHRHPLTLWANIATDVEVQKKAFHYTNLSPKWGTENSRKGNRFIEPVLVCE